MRPETKIWHTQSKYDFECAKDNLKIKRYSWSVFLYQQAVEKALKAYYFHKLKSNPGQTHSLIYLADKTKVPKKYFTFLKRLTPQFVSTRYPDAAYGSPSELYDHEIAKDFITKSEEVLKWINSQIKQ